MSTPRKARKCKTKITNDLLAHMDQLRVVGLHSNKIAPILNISESTAKRYIHVLNAIEEGRNFNLAGDLNWSAITNYCMMLHKPVPANLHGIPDKPEQIPGQMKMEIEQKPEISIMLKDIATAIMKLAEYIESSKED